MWVPRHSLVAFSAFTAHCPVSAHPSRLSLCSPSPSASGGPHPPLSPSPSRGPGLCIPWRYYFTLGVVSLSPGNFSSPLSPPFSASPLTWLWDPSPPRTCYLQKCWVGTQERASQEIGVYFCLQVTRGSQGLSLPAMLKWWVVCGFIASC